MDPIFDHLTALPPDALFAIKHRYSLDNRSMKVDLGIGAYRDDNGNPWILPSIKLAEDLVPTENNYNHEYMSIRGNINMTNEAAKIIIGNDLYNQDKTVSFQSLSGTGALHLAAKILSKSSMERNDKRLLYLSNPTWPNHENIFESAGFELKEYAYWDPINKKLLIDDWINDINNAPNGSIFVLHSCAHNPTGLDPTPTEWDRILKAIKLKKHIALFDNAYQGFASGDLDKDAYAIRKGIEILQDQIPIVICQSFSKNFGLYGERIGCLHMIVKDSKQRDIIYSQLSTLTRSEFSNPPAYGSKLVNKILTDDKIKQVWFNDLKTMSNRINSMRKELRDELINLNTPGNWDHIVLQCGMFSYTGLNEKQVEILEKEHAVYLARDGRASMAGLNSGNVKYVAKCIDKVVRG